MTEKPGWFSWWWGNFPKEGTKKIDNWNSRSNKDSSKIWWSIWHTLDEVEKLLKEKREKKTYK